MKKKWAFIAMNAAYDPSRQHARFDTPDQEGHLLTVRSAEDAVILAAELAEQGFGAIEVCGAFGPQLARRMYEATGCRVPVSFITTEPDELDQVKAFWSGK